MPKEKANGGTPKGKMAKRYCRVRYVEEYLGFVGNEANAQRSTPIKLGPPLATASVPQEPKEMAMATPKRPIRSPIRKKMFIKIGCGPPLVKQQQQQQLKRHSLRETVNSEQDGIRPAVVYSTKSETMAQNANSASMLKAFAPVPIAEEPLQMTQQNCRKMKSYATMFGVSDPRGWVKSNCFFLQMYVRASCEDISTFVSSCANYEQKETNGGNK
uniref:aECM cysteine-cradle domain-containing protein n=1 Tax=Globodera pallida TaxID=36090 RepID=A0A183C3I1_GLOPA